MLTDCQDAALVLRGIVHVDGAVAAALLAQDERSSARERSAQGMATLWSGGESLEAGEKHGGVAAQPLEIVLSTWKEDDRGWWTATRHRVPARP